MLYLSANMIIDHILFNVLYYVRLVVSRNQQFHSFFYFKISSCNLSMSLVQKIDLQIFFLSIMTCLLYLKRSFSKVHLLFHLSAWFQNFCNFALFLFVSKICITRESSIIIKTIKILFRMFKILNSIKMTFSFWFFMNSSRIWEFSYSKQNNVWIYWLFLILFCMWMSFFCQMRVSARMLSFSNLYLIMKWNCENSSAHSACQKLNFLMIIKYSRTQ